MAPICENFLYKSAAFASNDKPFMKILFGSTFVEYLNPCRCVLSLSQREINTGRFAIWF